MTRVHGLLVFVPYQGERERKRSLYKRKHFLRKTSKARYVRFHRFHHLSTSHERRSYLFLLFRFLRLRSVSIENRTVRRILEFDTSLVRRIRINETFTIRYEKISCSRPTRWLAKSYVCIYVNAFVRVNKTRKK